MQSACRGSYPAAGALACQKSLAEFRVRRRESSKIRFLPRHVRGRKHFARSERRIVRCQRTTEAQNAAKLSRKSGKATFSTGKNACRGPYPAAGAFSCLCARHTPPRGAPNRPYKYLPVILSSLLCISCGVPHATILPPASPPPGPMSMT